MTSIAPRHESTVAIIGVGLIGGSIAAALRRRKAAMKVIGIGRNAVRLDEARQAGLIDVTATSVDAARDAELVVVCTPVDRIVEDVRSVAAHLRPGAIITDAGSVKGRICGDLRTGLPEGVAFVGSHPLAGSEKNGWEHRDAELFDDRVCVVTPDSSTKPETLNRVEDFWRTLGMRIVRMSPEDHDRALAITSHVPHVAAAALAAQLTDQLRDLAATGFRDTTRIAAGDPELWTAILLANADSVSAGIDRVMEQLAAIRTAIDSGDEAGLQRLLAVARERRNLL
jgi:prephenate dehydrogenase